MPETDAISQEATEAAASEVEERENPLIPEISDAPEIQSQEIQEPGKEKETSVADAGHAEAGILPSGITKVRGLRMTNLATLLAIIAPGAKQLLELLAGFDPAHLQHLLVRLTQYGEIKAPATDATGLEERVVVGAQIFEAWSRMTPGTRDDDYSNWLNRILHDNALRDEFVALVKSDIDGSPCGISKLNEAAKQAGIEGPEVLNFSKTIAGVIASMK